MKEHTLSEDIIDTFLNGYWLDLKIVNNVYRCLNCDLIFYKYKGDVSDKYLGCVSLNGQKAMGSDCRNDCDFAIMKNVLE